MCEDRSVLRRKLTSRRGASITFALLLFLVCTVIGVIVLVAGTAASGRVSRLADSDRRYYAVNSAAQLLREEIEGSTVTVNRTMTTTGTYIVTAYRYKKADDSYASDSVITGTALSVTYSESQAASELDILDKAAQYYVYGAPHSTTLNREEWLREVSLTQTAETTQLTAEPVSITLKDDQAVPQPVEGALELKMEATLLTSGELKVAVWYEDEDKKEIYRLTMTFKANWAGNYSNTEDVTITTGTVPAGGETVGSDSFQVYEVGLKEDVFSWTLQEITKG